MKISIRSAPVFLAASFLALFPAQAQDGDAAAGKKVFNKCRACHDAEAEKNKVGPHLVDKGPRHCSCTDDGRHAGRHAWSA